ncbi:hypothetical protein CMUS01_05991 [Colletotrichum musicola]|uniref:Uncharacterized protein n=1 Tax=Colletotrichum musicola TaxID=2175873 RepID=A0A8H6KPH2_9PEZI|nr:hypothetical protein CMUS01_05991 [Colletotrichum musicola]
MRRTETGPLSTQQQREPRRGKKKAPGMKSLSTWALIKHSSPVQKFPGSRLVMAVLAASERHGKKVVHFTKELSPHPGGPLGTFGSVAGGKKSGEPTSYQLAKDITENGKEEEQKKRSANTLIAVPYLDEAWARRDAAASVSMRAFSISYVNGHMPRDRSPTHTHTHHPSASEAGKQQQ